MTKRRPVIVLSPQLKNRPGLCTVVALSNTVPTPKRPYHYKFELVPPLPFPYDSKEQWVKGDMIYSFSFRRLNLPKRNSVPSGTRVYDIRVVNDIILHEVEKCVLSGLGIEGVD